MQSRRLGISSTADRVARRTYSLDSQPSARTRTQIRLTHGHRLRQPDSQPKKMQKRKAGTKGGMWDAFQNVTIAAMNKGQFPALCLAGLLAMCIYKMPPADVSRLVFEVKSDLVQGHLLGYAYGAVVTVLWFIHARSQRRAITDEMSRIAGERTKLQDTSLGSHMESSN